MNRGGNVKSCSGYLTVYLALTLAVLLSLCLALIEGVRSNAIRIETECVVDIGLNSILAEYHRELLDQYNLFAVDSSYGTSTSGLQNVTNHLQNYLERNLSMEDVFLSDYLYRDFLAISIDSIELTRASILTDEGGTVFRRRAVEAIKDDCNLTLLQDLLQWTQVVEDKGLRDRDIAAEKQSIDAQIQNYDGREIQISETEWSTVQVENPTDGLELARKTGILKYVVDDADALSGKRLQLDNLILSRMEQGEINMGNIPLSQLSDSEQLLDRFFFQEYLMRYLGHYRNEKAGGALSYQIEYLLAGKDSDIENLKQVVDILCAVREAANAIYLFSDAEKCNEAGSVAAVISAVLLMPELKPLFETALILGWAYAESLYDVETLLSGGRIPLIKDKESWHYDIDSALEMRDDSEEMSSKGLSYEDYLRLMMMFMNLDTLTARAMNVVEADIRLTSGNSFFRLDNCYDQVEFYIQVKSKYGYAYDITRRKRY